MADVKVGDLVYGVAPYGAPKVESRRVVKVTDRFIYVDGYLYSPGFTRRISRAAVSTSPTAALDARIAVTRAEIERAKDVLHRLRSREGEFVKFRNASASEPDEPAAARKPSEGGA